MHSTELTAEEYSAEINLRKDKEGSSRTTEYDINLINELKNDHEEIVSIYEKVLQSASDQNYGTLQLLLVGFATAFTNHIQVEEKLLDGYLKILVKRNSVVEQKIVSQYAEEMKEISILIFTFFSQSSFIPVNEKNIDEFVVEFKKIGLLLEDRIEREERILYPIYKNSRKTLHISS